MFSPPRREARGRYFPGSYVVIVSTYSQALFRFGGLHYIVPLSLHPPVRFKAVEFIVAMVVLCDVR